LTVEVTVLKKEPAVLLAIVAAAVSAIVQAVTAGQTDGGFDVWSAVLVGLPLLAGIATRFHVVPAEVVKTALNRATTAAAAVNDLAARVDAADAPTS
jgi:hypothetical protein